MSFFLRVVRSPAGASVLAAVVAIVGVMFVVVAGGYDLAHAAAALWDGSAGSSYSFFTGTLVRATPLILFSTEGLIRIWKIV